MQGVDMSFRIVAPGRTGLVGGEDTGDAGLIEPGDSVTGTLYQVEILQAADITGFNIDGPVSVKKNYGAQMCFGWRQLWTHLLNMRKYAKTMAGRYKPVRNITIVSQRICYDS